jgi:molybdate ABC transporter permease protein
MPLDWFPLWLSLKVATTATLISVALGLWLAWLLANRDFPGKNLVDAIATLPLALPPTVLGYYLLVVIGRSSWIGLAWEAVTGSPLVFTWRAAVIASTLHAIPLLIKSSRAALESVDLACERAARSLGASEWRLFWRVSLPLARRPIAAATVLAFARSLGDFGATLMIAGDIPGRTQTAAIAIYDAVESGNTLAARVLVIVISILTAAVVLLANRLERRRVRIPAGSESAAFELNVEFEAAPGVTVLYGPSGSGKTLTLDAIAGFVAPDSGRILLHDRILFDSGSHVHLPPRERQCGYVFQNYALFPHMTLRANLAFAAHRLPRLERHRRIAELLDRFRIADLAGRLPHELSGGQKQRASIARSLIANPGALLLDEPGNGLDATLRADLHSLILEIRQSLSIPILLVTHNPEECFALADQVLIYNAGRILHRAAPGELLSNPATADVARLLGGFNIYEAEVVTLDPGRQTSRVRLLDNEIDGPHLRGCFRGDRVALCVRPEELRIATRPGANRIRAGLARVTDRTQSVRADFGNELIVDSPRGEWLALKESGEREGWWVELPAASLRQIARAK